MPYRSRHLLARATGLTAVAAVSGLFLGACGGGTSSVSTGGDLDALHRSAEGMLALRTMTATITTPDPGGQSTSGQQVSTAYYQAPDRFEALSGTPQEVAQIVANGTVYVPAPPSSFQPVPGAAVTPPRTGYFQALPGLSPERAVGGFLLPLRALARATSARRVGDSYHVTASPGLPTASTIDATVTNGLIPALTVTYTVQGKRYATRFLFSAFNSLPPISAPPANLVVPTPATSQPPAPCRPGQPSSPSCAPQYHPVKLPPVGAVHSTLQVRPVLDGNAVGCVTAPGQNPDPSATVAVPGPQPGTCLRLGPSTLTVSHAQTTATQDQSGKVQLDFKLDPGDAASFDQLAQANYQRQVALVMFGQVLSAPTIHATSFGGRGQIIDLTIDQAARAAGALSGT